jgi:hypothetical protein
MVRNAAAFLLPNPSLHALLNIFFSSVNRYKIEFIAAASAIIIESAKIYPAFSSISILSIVIIISASICGAAIYRLQLSAIERLTL